MDAMRSLYCKVFVDADITEDELLEAVSEITHGVPRIGRTVTSADCEVDVVSNEDFDRAKRVDGDDQFLFYPYYLDVLPAAQVSRERYIKSIGDLLESLWRAGCKAVAACSFEDELPRRGGYKSQMRT